MRSMPLLFSWVTLALCLFSTSSLAQAASRTWTSTDGRVMQAVLVAVEAGEGVFQLAAGQTSRVPLARLSPADQEWIKQWLKQAPAGRTAASSGTIQWPDTVSAPPAALTSLVKPVSEAAGGAVFRSRSFQFSVDEKLAASAIAEVARTFEATYELLKALPWGIRPQPDPASGFFAANLWASRTAYEWDVARAMAPKPQGTTGSPQFITPGQAGNAAAYSGGMYLTHDRTFRIPFESLGLVKRGSSWFKNESYTSDTLVHEVTHQMMHDYLPFLPNWVGEGMAEYTNMLPYKAGTFRAGDHESGLRKYVKTQLSFLNDEPLSTLGDAWDHLNMPANEWSRRFASAALTMNLPGANSGNRDQRRLYGLSCLLVYYFCHLDGDGRGTRFRKYLEAMAAEAAVWQEFTTGQARHQKEMEDFLKLPGVTKLENGQFRHPSELKPPTPPERPKNRNPKQFGMEQMSLLVDGRSAEAFRSEFAEALKKAGLKW